MINQIVIMGRLAADPELRSTQTGTAVCNFRVAVDRGGKEKEADFVPCVAWRQTAEFVNRYFRKGQMIACVGSLRSRQYEDKAGEKRTVWEVQVDRTSFCGSKAETGAETQTQTASQTERLPFDDDLEALPFL